MNFILTLGLTLLLTLSPCISNSEIYRGISPTDTLADLKAKFPQATFEKQNPAWAQDEDVMYTITGSGISGSIVVTFHDARPYWKKRIAEEQDENRKEFLTNLANRPDDDIVVSWVRWLPDVPFPISRLITKYGKPEISDFSNEDYRPYKEWTKRGILASLTDDGKRVLMLEFAFTPKEHDVAWNQKYGMPDAQPSKKKKNKKK